jgi:methyltransferase (TIGR00027 family)
MEPNQVSVSARIAAFVRAYHSLHDDPKIFDDPLAIKLFTEAEVAQFSANLAESLKFFDPQAAAACPDPATALHVWMRAQSGPITLTRARYAEDALSEAVARGVRQYVILGAGLDTFVFRRPDLVQQLEVFEIDHPGTQAFKRQRLAELGWDQAANVHYLPVDLAAERLDEALVATSYDPQAATFTSWLGVTYYLSRQAVLATLSRLASLAPNGSAVIFDYLDADAFVPERTATRVRRMQEATRMAGEPMTTGFDPAALGADLSPLGLRLAENLSPADLEARYFAGREDGYHAFEHIHFARVEVAR